MPKDNQYPNEIGAGWKKTSDRGEFFSLSIDLDVLAELRGGDVGGKVDLNMYAITFEKTNPKAPDYRVKFFPRGGARPAPSRQPAALPIDDDIPI